MNYALHFTEGQAAVNEMYVWFQEDGAYYIQGDGEKGWTEPHRLGHMTPDMSDYLHLHYALKPDYSGEVERVSMQEVVPKKEGEEGRWKPDTRIVKDNEDN